MNFAGMDRHLSIHTFSLMNLWLPSFTFCFVVELEGEPHLRHFQFHLIRRSGYKSNCRRQVIKLTADSLRSLRLLAFLVGVGGL